MDDVGGINTFNDLFSKIIDKYSFFIDREILRSNYIPEFLPHREKEFKDIGFALGVVLNNSTPSNISIYGKPGTGKTATTKLVGKELLKKAEEINKRFLFVYINCNISRSTYSVIQKIVNELLKNEKDSISLIGLPLDTAYKRLVDLLERKCSNVIVVLDEVDKLRGDDLIYILTRINTDLINSRLSTVLISNNIRYKEFLDSRVLSSLGGENIVFSPYNAIQLEEILRKRVENCLKPNILDDDVIPLCAAIAAQQNGDARHAIDLLRVSIEIGERNADKKITISHVKQARNKIEIDYINETIKNLPEHYKFVLYSVSKLDAKNKTEGLIQRITTGEIYKLYHLLCNKSLLNPLSERRISDIISEFETLGIVYTKIVSKGRQGRTREICLSTHPQKILQYLCEDQIFSNILGVKVSNQTRFV